MKTTKLTYLASLASLIFWGCGTGDEYEPQYNVAEGVYIVGSASKFSTETAYGMLKETSDPRLYSIVTWLKPEGEFRISLSGTDNAPVMYGAEKIEGEDDSRDVWSLSYGGSGMTVKEEGLYKLFFSRSLAQVTVIPMKFSIYAKAPMNEAGESVIPLDALSYDNSSHIVTFKNSDNAELFLSGEYKFAYTPSGTGKVKITENKEYSFSTSFTGTAVSVKTNVLTSDWSKLTDESAVNLKLKRRGEYVFSLKYDVKKDAFSAKLDGFELVEPEPEGYSKTLYMTGADFGGGDWKSPETVSMTPCGVEGNGAFWTMAYFRPGAGVRWSETGSDSDAFASGDQNFDFKIVGNSAEVETEGCYLVYVDLSKKLIAFETPVIYGMGDCFGGNDVLFVGEGGKYSLTTEAEGNMRMYAVCSYNTRDWDSMEFNIRKGRIAYRGVGGEFSNTPVAAGIPVVLNFKEKKADFEVTMTGEVPTAGQVYMICSEYGNMNWGDADDVIKLNSVWGSDSKYIYVRYFSKGTRIRFSTGGVFGKDEFVQIGDSPTGYTVEDGYAVVPADGIYGIFVNLGTRLAAIQPATIHTYGSASEDEWGGGLDDPFTATDDPAVVSYTVAKDGRLRLNPWIEAFDFGSWQREYYVDLQTNDLKMRMKGEDEPNASHTWTAGTVIKLNFKTMKAEIK